MPKIVFNGRPFSFGHGQTIAGMDAEHEEQFRQILAGFSHNSSFVEVSRMTEENLSDMRQTGLGCSFKNIPEVRPELLRIKMRVAVHTDAGQGKTFRQRAFSGGLFCALFIVFG